MTNTKTTSHRSIKPKKSIKPMENRPPLRNTLWTATKGKYELPNKSFVQRLLDRFSRG